MAAIQTKTGVTAGNIRADYWFGTVRSLIPLQDISDDYLTNKIRGQEDGMERELGLLWQEKRVRSEPKDAETDWDIFEQAYDYEADFFVGERWGFLKLRRYPVKSIQRVVFAYPNIDQKTFKVPTSWIRLEREYGYLRLVPDGLAIMTSFSGYVLSVLSGGRGIPATILVDYTAGFQTGTLDVKATLSADHNDLIEHLKYSVIADVLKDGFLPGSSSIAADGLSRSVSLELKGVYEEQHRQRQVFKDKYKGVIMTIV